ncbi:MAG: hypothetical protein ACKVOL_09675 [Novosphingobium sp.]
MRATLLAVDADATAHRRPERAIKNANWAQAAPATQLHRPAAGNPAGDDLPSQGPQPDVFAAVAVPPVVRRTLNLRAAGIAAGSLRTGDGQAAAAVGDSPGDTNPAAESSLRPTQRAIAAADQAADSRGAPPVSPNPVVRQSASPPSSTTSSSALLRSQRPRWSADAWALVRGGRSAPALATGAAAYGGSQMGAVLRYNLAPSSPIRPQIYVRATAALATTVREPEGALGFVLRPVRRLPLAVMGEVRVQAGSGPARVRPVIMAVSELAPLRLPLGSEAEVYAQAGWAGGSFPTAFYDAAAVVERGVAEPVRGFALRAGGGLWTGGQTGAARLDIGPRIELRTMAGAPGRRIGMRLAFDWRFRVAGRAEPGSGPAVTLSTGF